MREKKSQKRGETNLFFILAFIFENQYPMLL